MYIHSSNLKVVTESEASTGSRRQHLAVGSWHSTSTASPPHPLGCCRWPLLCRALLNTANLGAAFAQTSALAWLKDEKSNFKQNAGLIARLKSYLQSTLLLKQIPRFCLKFSREVHRTANPNTCEGFAKSVLLCPCSQLFVDSATQGRQKTELYLVGITRGLRYVCTCAWGTTYHCDEWHCI